MKTLHTLVCLALLPTACDSGEPASQPSAPAASVSPTPPTEAKPERDDATAAEGGAVPAGPAAADVLDAAFFNVRDKGLVALTDDGFSVVPNSQTAFVSRLGFGADGKLYAQTASEIAEVRTGGLSPVARIDYDVVGSVADFDVGRDGVIWVVGTSGISTFRDGAWSTQSKAEVGLSDDFAVGIALDAAGEPWAATNDSIVHRTGQTWQKATLPGAPTKFLATMRRGPDGHVYLSTYDRLFRLTDPPGRVTVKMGTYESPSAFTFSQATYGAAKGLESASIFLPASAAVLYRNKDLKIGTISAVAVDEQGRLWAAGEGGIAIAGPKDARVTWRSGSVEEVAGQVSHLIVRGRGPKLPEAGAIKKGGLTGRVIQRGAGVAGVKIELCESPSLVYSRTPCSGAPTHLRGTTDAEGRFEFKDVPLGAYGLAVKSGRQWKITLGAALGTRMVEGETYDLGSVTLE